MAKILKNKPQDAPKPPAHLSRPSKAWFECVVAEYEFEPHGIRLLTLACEAWDRGQQARRMIEKHGLTFIDFHDQPKARPEIAIERDSRLSFARLVRELALEMGEPDEQRPPRIVGTRACG